MKNKFFGYYRPKPEDCAQRFKEAIFVFDTNGLLNLYKYTPESRDNLLKVLKTIKDRVWIPHQVGYEYHDNRVGVIISQREMYNALKNGVDEAIKALDKQRRSINFHVTSLIEPIRKALDEVKADLDKKRAEHPDLLTSDPILDALTELFDGKVGEPYSSEEHKKKLAVAKQRFEAKAPPGFLDSTGRKKKEGDRQYGDVIVWLQLLDFAKASGKPVILITDETGEDWWQKDGGRTIGPRPELLQEMYIEANGKWFYMYSMDQFLGYSKELLELDVKPEVIKEAKEIKEENEVTEQMMRAAEDAAEKKSAGVATADSLVGLAKALRLQPADLSGALQAISHDPTFSQGFRQAAGLTGLGEALAESSRDYHRAWSHLSQTISEQQRAFQSVSVPILEQYRTLQKAMSPIAESLRRQQQVYESITRPFRELTASLQALGAISHPFKDFTLGRLPQQSHNRPTDAEGKDYAENRPGQETPEFSELGLSQQPESGEGNDTSPLNSGHKE